MALELFSFFLPAALSPPCGWVEQLNEQQTQSCCGKRIEDFFWLLLAIPAVLSTGYIGESQGDFGLAYPTLSLLCILPTCHMCPSCASQRAQQRATWNTTSWCMGFRSAYAGMQCSVILG